MEQITDQDRTHSHNHNSPYYTGKEPEQITKVYKCKLCGYIIKLKINAEFLKGHPVCKRCIGVLKQEGKSEADIIREFKL